MKRTILITLYLTISNFCSAQSIENAKESSLKFLREEFAQEEGTETENSNSIEGDSLIRGSKQYELTNHLGNVLATISDKRIQNTPTPAGTSGVTADLLTATDYYTFGMQMPGRCFSDEDYRFGFNCGNEKEDEISGEGNIIATEYRELDTRLGGRWWSPDPIVKPWESPYAGFANNPIYYSDPFGLDPPVSGPDDDCDQNNPDDRNYADWRIDHPGKIKGNAPSGNNDKTAHRTETLSNQIKLNKTAQTNESQIQTSTPEIKRPKMQNQVANSNSNNDLTDKISMGASFVDDYLLGLSEQSYKIGSKYAIGLKYAQRINGVRKSADLLARANQIHALTIAKTIGHFSMGLGLFGAGLNIYTGASDGYFTEGELVKVELQLASTFIPTVGWGYGLVDLGFQVFSEKSLTDRAGAYIDAQHRQVPVFNENIFILYLINRAIK